MFHSAKISTLKNYWDSQPTYYYVCLSKVACEIQKYMIVLWLVLCVNWLWITMVPSYSIQIYVLLWRYFVYGINIFNWLSLNKGDYLYNVGKRHPIIWKALRKQMRFHWERVEITPWHDWKAFYSPGSETVLMMVILGD